VTLPRSGQPDAEVCSQFGNGDIHQRSVQDDDSKVYNLASPRLASPRLASPRLAAWQRASGSCPNRHRTSSRPMGRVTRAPGENPSDALRNCPRGRMRPSS
jgi:hypothetical protein